MPPLRAQKPNVPCFEGTRLQYGIHGCVVRLQNVDNTLDRYDPVANGAADETVAFIGELHAVVLEMQMAHQGSYTSGKIQRSFAHLPVSKQMPTAGPAMWQKSTSSWLVKS